MLTQIKLKWAIQFNTNKKNQIIQPITTVFIRFINWLIQYA